MEFNSRSAETLSEQYVGGLPVGNYRVVEESANVPGQHPEPHLRYEAQGSYLERYYRCLRCDIDVLRIKDFPNTCTPPRFVPGYVVIDEQKPDNEGITI